VALANDYFYLDDFVVGNAPNVITGESADFETSVGAWGTWYSANLAHATDTAFTGTGSLRIAITDPWGWAIQAGNWPGFDTNSGGKKVSFQAKQGTSGVSNVTLTVKWYDANNQLLQEDPVTLSNLSGSWQKGEAQLAAPVGTAHAYLEVSGDDGTTGDILYIDNLSIISLD